MQGQRCITDLTRTMRCRQQTEAAGPADSAARLVRAYLCQSLQQPIHTRYQLIKRCMKKKVLCCKAKMSNLTRCCLPNICGRMKTLPD